jgi:hypothetical protein
MMARSPTSEDDAAPPWAANLIAQVTDMRAAQTRLQDALADQGVRLGTLEVTRAADKTRGGPGRRTVPFGPGTRSGFDIEDLRRDAVARRPRSVPNDSGTESEAPSEVEETESEKRRRKARSKGRTYTAPSTDDSLTCRERIKLEYEENPLGRYDRVIQTMRTTANCEPTSTDARAAMKYLKERVPLGKFQAGMRLATLINKIHEHIEAGDTEKALGTIAGTYCFLEQYGLDAGQVTLAWMHTLEPPFSGDDWKKELGSTVDLEAKESRLVDPRLRRAEQVDVRRMHEHQKLAKELAAMAKEATK